MPSLNERCDIVMHVKQTQCMEMQFNRKYKLGAIALKQPFSKCGPCPGSAPAASTGHLLAASFQAAPQIYQVRNSGMGPSSLGFNQPSRCLWCPLKFGNHCLCFVALLSNLNMIHFKQIDLNIDFRGIQLLPTVGPHPMSKQTLNCLL